MLAITGHPVPDCAMVMAAGMGTRMRPLTRDCPKPLVMVGPETLLDHVLGHLRQAGVGRIVVNVHYLADQIEAHLADHARDFDVAISDERGQLLETGGGLMHARNLLTSEPFLCVNTDNVWTNDSRDNTIDNSITHMASHWDDNAMDVLMLLVPTAVAQYHSGQGDFQMDADGRLQRRGAAATAPYVWTGVQMLSHRILRDAPSDKFSTNIFWDRALTDRRMFGVVHTGAWFDVGTPDAISPVADHLKSHRI